MPNPPKDEIDVKVVPGNHAILSDGTTWPMPDLADDGLAWRLTYGVTLSSAETMQVAAIVRAYTYLIAEANQGRRAQVVRDLRVAMQQQVIRPGSEAGQ